MPLAIKMNARFFFKLYRANFNSLKYWCIPPTGLSRGDRTQVRTQSSGREEIEFVPVLTSSKQRHKRKFNVLFV